MGRKKNIWHLLRFHFPSMKFRWAPHYWTNIKLIRWIEYISFSSSFPIFLLKKCSQQCSTEMKWKKYIHIFRVFFSLEICKYFSLFPALHRQLIESGSFWTWAYPKWLQCQAFQLVPYIKIKPTKRNTIINGCYKIKWNSIYFTNELLTTSFSEMTQNSISPKDPFLKNARIFRMLI